MAMEDMELKMIGVGLLAIVILGVAGTALADLGFKNEKPGEEVQDTQSDSETAELPEPSKGTTVYFFWGDGCPHCAKEKPFLEGLDREHENLEVKMYEVYNSKENQRLYRAAARQYGIQARGVPATFIGEDHWIGYNRDIRDRIEKKVEECLEKSCEGPLENS